jgi:hypothetical protein
MQCQEIRWRKILIATIIYQLFALPGNWLSNRNLNTIGFALYTIIIFFLLPKAFLRPQRSGFMVAIWPLLAIFISVIVNLPNIQIPYLPIYISEILKCSSLFLLYIVFRSCSLCPIAVSKNAKLYAFAIGFPILLSLVSGRYMFMEGETRLTGVFAHPAVLGLFPFLLPWILTKNTGFAVAASVHFIVVSTIVLTNTLGALISYLAAILLVRYGLKRLIIILVPAAASALALLYVMPNGIISALDQFPATHKALTQYRVLSENLESIFGSVAFLDSPDYGGLLLQYGGDALSGLWRLSFWAHILSMVADSGFFSILFGHGVGSAYVLLPLLPHNDYIRIIFEQGLFGIGCFILFFVFGVFNKVLPEHRYLVVAFLFTCFVESRLDDFMFISLFSAMISANSARIVPS